MGDFVGGLFGSKPKTGMKRGAMFQPYTYKSLTGDCYIAKDFTHNNMVPYFWSKVTQSNVNYHQSSILDNTAGSGSQIIRKVEAAPLFKPEDNVQYAHGNPVYSDFYQSRVIPS